MSYSGIAKLFRNGRSQAVRLPHEFRFAGDQVRVSRVRDGVLLQPLISDPAQWFQELDRLSRKFVFEHGRKQPVTPRREVF